jgi:predicted transglutaminase-like cysteine proteinase
MISFTMLVTPTLAAKRTVLEAPIKAAFGPNGVFQSLEFETNASTGITNWRNASARIAGERATYAACDLDMAKCPTQLRKWRSNLKAWATKSTEAKLILVNRFANAAVRYTDDIATFRTADYWASPAQSLKGRGDCEDYALLKYESLKALGFAENNLRIVVLKDLRKGIGHAVLSVKTEAGNFILDNQDNRVLRHDTITHYAPIFSINANKRWINIATRSLKKNKPAVTLVASAAELEDIQTAAAPDSPVKAKLTFKPKLKPMLAKVDAEKIQIQPRSATAQIAMLKVPSSSQVQEPPTLATLTKTFIQTTLVPLTAWLRPVMEG